MENDNLKNQVLDRIKTEHTQIKPRWHFVLKATLFSCGCLALFFLLIYLLSLAFFVLDENNLWFAPSLGARGVWVFLVSLPWLLIALVVLFLIILQILVRQYAFSYHRPLFFSALFILGVVIVGSMIVRATGFRTVSFARPMYERFIPHELEHIFPGMILEFHEKNFSLQNHSKQILQVHVGPETRLPQGFYLRVGDEVIVIGDRRENIIEAAGIRPVPQNHVKRTFYFEMEQKRHHQESLESEE